MAEYRARERSAAALRRTRLCVCGAKIRACSWDRHRNGKPHAEAMAAKRAADQSREMSE